jgi:hypothetical protein
LTKRRSGGFSLYGRHLGAARGAAAAHLDTKHHGLIVSESRAVLSAHFADTGADAAGHLVQRRTAQHEIGVRNANLGAVLEDADVLRSGMIAAFGETVRDGFETDGVAIETVLDAFLHGRHDNLLLSAG